jgi:hypothetical protein
MHGVPTRIVQENIKRERERKRMMCYRSVFIHNAEKYEH